MNKIFCLCLLVMSVGVSFDGNAKETLSGPIPAKVIRVIDGDTIVVDAHIWLGQKVETMVRIYGIDTPEIKGKCEFERQKAIDAKKFVEKALGKKKVLLQEVSHDKYAGRIVAVVETDEYKDLGAEMVKQGLAREYFGKTKVSWCKDN